MSTYLADTYPPVMTLPEVAAVMRLKPKSILNALAASRFVPLPFAERPYRWRRDDIERWMHGDYQTTAQKLRVKSRRAA